MTRLIGILMASGVADFATEDQRKSAAEIAHIKEAIRHTQEIFGLGERCVMRWRYSWVDTAGERGHVRGVDIFRVRNGAIREKLSYVKG